MDLYSIAFVEITLLEKVTIRLWGKLADQLEFAWLKCPNHYHFREEFHLLLFMSRTEVTYRPRDIFRDLHALITFPIPLLESKSVPKNYKSKTGAYHSIRCTGTEQHTMLIPGKGRAEQGALTWVFKDNWGLSLSAWEYFFGTDCSPPCPVVSVWTTAKLSVRLLIRIIIFYTHLAYMQIAEN